MWVMKAPEREALDNYHGGFREKFIEYTYHSRIEVINGLAIIDDVKDYEWLHARGYVEIPLDRVCLICRKDFKSKEEKIKHDQHQHTPIKKWICDICGKSYTRKYTLWDHIRRVHNQS